MVYREYDPARDKEAARRVWREVGWIEPGKEDVADAFLAGRRAFVAEIQGQAECVVTSASGVIRYLDEDLPFVGCTGVATSRVARRQGLAKRLLARVLAADVADGAAVAGINVFEQGFYDQLGYGMGGYEHHFSFDPSALNVSVRPRVPRRLTRGDIELMHAS
ncbi:MAG: GNAT family N-acetyltransferase, partial [Proteobacteria bacterium]|nr:GNAT family N-acetyltransferase [Pseudomonadota bacterium]